MNRKQEWQNKSLLLSTVLGYIGINEENVTEKRRLALLMETMWNVHDNVIGSPFTVRYFGSFSEGTTTPGLQSDYDALCCCDKVNVIQDLKDWKYGFHNLLMIEDTTAPGYCLLQVLRSDKPFPETHLLNRHYIKDELGRILLKTSYIHSSRLPEQQQHGPASCQRAIGYIAASDRVFVFPCRSLHHSVRQWLTRPTHNAWPTYTMKSYIANTRCYVAPVGSRGSANEGKEWRISTSEAERCLLYNLNIIQIRVYVLMKMLLKEKINARINEESRVSSYMCKTILFHCIEFTMPSDWLDQNLLSCLVHSLQVLRNSIGNEYCAHFIIRESNLMFKRFSPIAKRQLILNINQILQDVFYNGVLGIRTDDLGLMLMVQVSKLPFDWCHERTIYHAGLAMTRLTNVAICRLAIQISIFRELYYCDIATQLNILMMYVKGLRRVFGQRNLLVRSACTLLIPVFCAQIGSLLASASIQASGTISSRALQFFYIGLDTDAATSRLKLATVFYFIGDMQRAVNIVSDVENRCKLEICAPVCNCSVPLFKKLSSSSSLSTRINQYIEKRYEKDIKTLTASCVIFLPTEIIFKELQYEMFRSTEVDRKRRESFHYWMDWAVVDSVPYLYFLQYKVYGHLRRTTDKQRALNNLAYAIESDPQLRHTDTAFNLLGQCLEAENRHFDALMSYIKSLTVRKNNNAASLHICRILYPVSVMLKVCKVLGIVN